MKRLFFFLILAAAIGLFFSSPSWKRSTALASDDSSEKSPRLLVHLLDYLAVDYGGAVKEGKVLSVPEYKEQLEFVQTAVELSQTLPEIKNSVEIRGRVQDLSGLIHSKADPVKVATAARQTQAQVIALIHLPVSPGHWPNLATGKMLF